MTRTVHILVHPTGYAHSCHQTHLAAVASALRDLSGRLEVASTKKIEALGTGDGEWVTVPAIEEAASELLQRLGYRITLAKQGDFSGAVAAVGGEA